MTDFEIPRAVLRLFYPYMQRSATEEGTPEWAFGEVRGWEHVSSIAALAKKHAPLVTIRCAKPHGTLISAVWISSSGPLLVTSHLYEPEDRALAEHRAALKRVRDGQVARGEQIKSEGNGWAPRLCLLDGTTPEVVADSDLFPLYCTDHGPRPLTFPDLDSQVKKARRTHPSRVLT